MEVDPGAGELADDVEFPLDRRRFARVEGLEKRHGIEIVQRKIALQRVRLLVRGVEIHGAAELEIAPSPSARVNAVELERPGVDPHDAAQIFHREFLLVRHFLQREHQLPAKAAPHRGAVAAGRRWLDALRWLGCSRAEGKRRG